MRINKSGAPETTPLIRGGRVDTTADGRLVIEGETFHLTDYVQPKGLTHPPATTTAGKDLAIPNATELDTPELRAIYSDTLGARIKDAFVDGDAIIYLCRFLVVACPLAIIAIVVSWVVSVVLWLTANILVIGTAVGVVLLLAILIPALLGGREVCAVVKGCPRGPTPGPIKIPL